MSLFHQDYDIYFCPIAEIGELKQFIHSHWKRNHALSVSHPLMDWQYYSKETNTYNFVIAKHNKLNEIHAILGFIPTRHFDLSISTSDLWLSVWKVRADAQVPGLGLFLLEFLNSCKNPRSICAVGLSKQVIPIYKLMGYTIGILKHYYIINDCMTDFKLIEHFDERYATAEDMTCSKKELHYYDKSDFLKLMKKQMTFEFHFRMPLKSLSYFFNRYYRHPLYDYSIYGVTDHDNLRGLLVIRRVSYNEHYALRIVDYFGDPANLIGALKAFQALLKIHNAEYIDFYNAGIEEEIMSAIGFVKMEKMSKIIIPNYFEPFERRNVDLDFAYKSNDKELFYIFKGDSDQDRPNFIE